MSLRNALRFPDFNVLERTAINPLQVCGCKDTKKIWNMQIYLQLLCNGVAIFGVIAYIDYEAKGKGTAKPCPNTIRTEWKKREAKRARHEKGRQAVPECNSGGMEEEGGKKGETRKGTAKPLSEYNSDAIDED